MSSPAHSLHVAVATPPTTQLVREQPDLRQYRHKMASSVSCCVTCNVAITTSPVAVKILGQLVSLLHAPLLLLRHSTCKQQQSEAEEGEELVYLPFLINWDGESQVAIP